jgi:E3 SUMO-protein ligase PIAS1
VEASGEWHTSDNKYGSASWKATHSSTAIPSQALPLPRKRTLSPSKSSSQLNGNSTADQNEKKRADVEIFVLDSDSDSDDEGWVKRELSPSFGSGSSAIINRPMQGVSLPSTSTTHSQSDIIDLTLDSDDEDPAPPPPPPRPVEKRKVLENTNPSPPGQAWKKARLDSSVPLTVARNINGNANGISGGGSSHSNDTGGTSVPSALRMLHFNPLRDAQRAQTSVFPSRPPIPVLPPTARPPSSVIRPPDLPTTSYRSPYRAAPRSNLRLHRRASINTHGPAVEVPSHGATIRPLVVALPLDGYDE